jgi:hypothetical protein
VSDAVEYVLYALTVQIVNAVVGMLIPTGLAIMFIAITTSSWPVGAALAIPAGFGPTGATATGVEEQPRNREVKEVPRRIGIIFITHTFHVSQTRRGRRPPDGGGLSQGPFRRDGTCPLTLIRRKYATP